MTSVKGSRPSGSVDGEPIREENRSERLQKILARAGIASRRKAEDLITQGRVQVNGQPVTALGSKADPIRDHIRVDGKLIHLRDEHHYYMMNKPKGYVTTVSDPQGRPTAMDLLSRVRVRLFPVGRLDFASDGLLLLTNDGDLANALTRAGSHVEKTYLVKVSGVPNEAALDRLRHGVSISIGDAGWKGRRVRTAPARIRLFRSGENPWYEIVLVEGRNRQLRKMFEEIGYHVEKIRRVGYGPLVLDVAPGEYRELTAKEVRLLQASANTNGRPERDRPTQSGLHSNSKPAARRNSGRKSLSQSAVKTNRRGPRPEPKRVRP